ncbi:MAG: phosphoribosylaminoimidazolesuccinocarboxamide synthase, partial [Dehalococcoidia bacterium]
MPTTLTKTDLPRPAQRGKVRDIYDLGDALLFVATDRISAFDVVLPTGVPERGVVLNALSRFWFQRLGGIVPNHFLAMGADAEKIAPYFPDLPAQVARRAMLVKKVKPVLVECIVRGYLAGSGWAEYQRRGTIGGRQAPEGLEESQRLVTPLFTPTTKAAEGHDELITMDQMKDMIGGELTRRLERLSLELYEAGHEYALGRGIIIADTKFEFGLLDGEVMLIDEALTPDSSRFWDARTY